MFKPLPFCFFIFISNFILAQGFQPLDIPFTFNNGTNLKSLTGGLNSPQFSKADFDNDGVDDLYIFDRATNVHVPLLITEENGATKYTFDYSIAQNLPKCKNWVALRDYNNDGVIDLFTYDAESQVYKGKYENGKLTFDPVELDNGQYMNFMTYYKSDNSKDFISLFPDDYPVIEDIDGDGDLDILAFGGKPSVSFFQNMAIEYGYPLDSLTYILADECWGRFARDINNEVIISNDINECASGFIEETDERVHLTLTLMVYDRDEDGDMDAIVGSATSVEFAELINNGPFGTAFMTEVYTDFPNYDIPVNINAYPTAFHLDVDNDGVAELLASPNQVENGEDIEAVWLYKEVGVGDTAVWERQQKDWLVEEMVDLGSNSAPAFLDYNADGLLDIVVGTGGLYLWTDKGSLALFENTGTPTTPAFTLVDEDWLEFSNLNSQFSNFAPSVGDLDNDGDMDLLVGTDNGELIFVENEAGAGNPVQFADVVIGWQNILVGKRTTPQIGDLNRDGLMDLLIGERNGNINYLPNIGEVGDPQFSAIHELQPNNEFFGEISTAGNAVLGNATPYLIDRETRFSLIVASGSAGLRLYEFTEDDLENIIPATNNNWGQLRMGDNLYPAAADLNGDGFMELVLGNRRGGLTIFGSSLGVSSTHPMTTDAPILTIYPNPVTEVLNIDWNESSLPTNAIYSIYNSLGELLLTTKSNLIEVGELPSGLYILEARSGNDKTATKFIKR